MRSRIGTIRKRKRWPAAAISLAAGLPLLAVAFFAASTFLPPPSRGEFAYRSPESYRILDRDGRLLREAVGVTGERSRYVELEGFSPELIAATVAVEDRGFRSHKGVDFPAFFRAAWGNIRGGRIYSGASTITMQAARLVLGIDHSFMGKILQMRAALRMERVFSKDEILELYLNLSPYGHGSVGAEAASQRYFGRRAATLSLGEAAFLAGLPQAPSAHDPFRNYSGALTRWKTVLDAMEKSGYDRESLAAVRAEPPRILPDDRTLTAGHFSDYVLSFRPEPGEIRTSLDMGLNESIERLIDLHIRFLKERRMGNAAAVVLDNASGAIIAMVGSKDWSDPAAGAVNGILALRQPGSTLKPFAYELALEKGTPTRTVMADVETEYIGSDHKLYIPQNYSRSFRGPVLLPDALAMSLNVPAIRLVSEKVGLEDFLRRLRELGFSSLSEGAGHYGLGVVLGNGEVDALDLAAAYSCLARGGTYIEPSPFSNAAQAARTETPRRVLDGKATALITQILSDDRRRVQAFGVDHPLMFDYPVAVKTGTSSNWRDTWCAGYTPEITLVVWAGNFDAEPMDEVTSLSGAGSLFSKIMALLEDSGYVKGIDFSYAPGMRLVPVCCYSGLSPGPLCSKTSIVPTYETEAPPECDAHLSVLVDVRSGAPARKGAPESSVRRETFLRLPAEFDEWMDENHFARPPSAEGGSGGLKVLRPRQGDVFVYEPGYDPKHQTAEFSALAPGKPENIRWVLDGKELAAVPWPYALNWPVVKGKHTLFFRAGKDESDSVEFTVK